MQRRRADGNTLRQLGINKRKLGVSPRQLRPIKRAITRSMDTVDPNERILPKWLRFEILKRDRFRCVYCGASADRGALLQIDHIVPVADGGKTVAENLTTSCEPCNGGKSATRLEVRVL